MWRIARPQQFDEDNSTVRVGTQWRIFHIHNIILLLPGDGWTDAIPKTTSRTLVRTVLSVLTMTVIDAVSSRRFHVL